MRLKNTFAIGTLIQFYELEMLDEHVKSCVKMLEGIENKENVTFVFCFSTQEYLEKIDWEYFEDKYGLDFGSWFPTGQMKTIQNIFEHKVGIKGIYPANLRFQFKTNQDDFYNIAASRRDFNWEWQDKEDLILWGETDSLWPSQTLQVLDQLHESVKNETPKYIVNFADRRLWDNSFAPLHPRYENVPFQDNDWQLTSEDSGKGYMSWERMEEINTIPNNTIQVASFSEPRFDGSCVGFSSDLLKSGVNIPKALVHCSEDISIGSIAKKLLGDQFVQYCFQNLLHVHNRRHPKKRTGVLNENNPLGKCTVTDKGEWWKILEDSSKANFSNLFTQKSFIKMDEVMEKIKLSKDLEK